MEDPKPDQRASAPTLVERKAPRSRPDTGPEPEPEPAPSPAASAFDPHPDRFRPLGELGRGGMGRVDEVFDQALGRPVALKQMLSDSPVDLARFEREARITARLEHPGIVPIHDAGRNADGTPYYVMRRIDGQPLDERVEGKPFEERLALVPNVLAVCDAVAFAHARKVIHRDIKPTNILIGPFGETLLIDWGIARTIGEASDVDSIPASEPELTRAGTVAGTPGFMAPEQARGETVDERVDVFALGATLFYVVAGKLPYAATTATEMIDHVGANRPPDWRRIPDETPPDLRAIVVKAMASERADRYVDAGALAADLRRFVSGKLVGAHRYSTFEQLRRFVRRHRGAMAVGAFAAIVIAVLAVLFVQRLVSERDGANRARELAEAQRLEAVAKSDQILVQHAMQLAEHDSAAAIVALRRLSPQSALWDRAAIVAAAAAGRGVPFGFAINSAQTVALEISPDSRRVVVARREASPLAIFDLVARTREDLGERPFLLQVKWIDDRWLIGAETDRIVMIDTATRATRALAIPARTEQIRTDGHGHAWMVSAGDLYALDPTTTTLGAPLVTGVDAVLPLDDGLLLVHDRRLELRRGDRVIPIPDSMGATSLVADGDLVAALRGDLLCTWRLAPVPTLAVCRPAAGGVPIAITDETLLVFGTQGLFEGGVTHGPLVHTIDLHSLFRTPHGYVYESMTGTIAGADHQGTFTIGARQVSYARIVQSADERFVVAISNGGELLAWDLDTIRPHVLGAGSGLRILGLTARAAWTYVIAGAVQRHDRATSATTVVFDAQMTSGSIDPGERWILGESRISDSETVLVHDVSTGKTQALPPGTQGLVGDRGPVILRDDGEAFRIEGGELGAHLGRLPPHASGFSTRGDTIVASYPDRVCRKRAGEEVACTPFTKPPEQLAVDDRGTAWVVAGQVTWRWPVGQPPVEIPTAQAFRYMMWSGSTLLGVGTSSLVILGETPRTISIPPMRELAPGSSTRVFGRSPKGMLVVIDLGTGMTYELPALQIDRFGFVASADAVAYISRNNRTHDNLLVWELDTPTEPGALRSWLSTVTNAKPIPDSDVVAWP